MEIVSDKCYPWLAEVIDYDVLTNKKRLMKNYIFTMLNKTQEIFKYTGLPDTINAKDLELYLQVNGYAIFTKVEDKYYIFYGGLGGVPNAYYLPTKAIVANPYLKYNANLEINDDCIIIQNDALYEGLMPINNKYAALMAECDISLRFAAINSRIPALAQADNDQTLSDLKELFRKIIDGSELSVVGNKALFDGLNVYDYASKNTNVQSLLELHRYLYAAWYNELGVKANYNMKREALNVAETSVNDDMLIPFIDVMLKFRKEGIEKINKKYGLNITVEISSIWKSLRDEIKYGIDVIKKEANENETKGNNNN